MKTSRNLTLILLLAIVVATIAGLVLTGRAPSTPAASQGQNVPAAGGRPLVDQQPLETATRLAALAATPEERQLAQDAARVADAEVDLAFAVALRTTSEQTGPKTPETRAIEERIRRAEAEIEADQERVKQLTEAAKKATGDAQESLQEQVDVIQAEIALDQDSLADAKQDLIRAGGDEHSRIQQLLDEHEALEHANGAVQVAAGSGSQPQSVFSVTSLIGKWRNWNAFRGKRDQLLRARQEALSAAATLSREHEELKKRVGSEQPQKKEQARNSVLARSAAPPGASRNQVPQQEARAKSKHAAAAAVSSLHHLSEDEKNLADLNKRVQDLQELGSVYGQWDLLVRSAARLALHDILLSVFWIILTILLVFFINWVIERLFSRLALEHKQRATLHAVTRISVQAVAALVILFVIFGTPSQLSTVLGLATAGLTVALKDFIISFLGWFVLMGRNGIHVGDWVEIGGVRGEVVEIGLLRTVLLETGNWTDAGQPTGRQVAFLNSFAVEGYYFNFTTSGQWLWDELQVLIPSGQDPYPLIEKIRDIVAKETEGNAQLAQQEWQRVTRRYGVGSFSAGPAVNIKATDLGVQVIVRYITRATERSEVRFRLNHAVVELLHRGKTQAAEASDRPQAEGVR